MKKFRIAMLCLLVTFLITGHAMAGKKVLVLVPSSEAGAKNVGIYYQFFEGVESVLKPNNIQIEYMFKDFESAPTEEGKRAIGQEVIAKILEIKPDVLVPVADTAVKYVASQIDSIPSFFGYVFGTLESMNLPKPNITGVTRRSFAPDIWGLASALFNAKTVAMLSKNNVAMAGVRKVLISKADGLEKLSGVRFQEMYLVDTFAQWQERVNNWPADFIYLADCSRLTKADGSEMLRADAVKWTVEHSKVPVIAAAGEDVESGALYTILTSEKKWGSQTGEMVLKYLNGTPIKDLSIGTVQKGALVINANTAVKYKIDIPYEILSSAEKVIE